MECDLISYWDFALYEVIMSIIWTYTRNDVTYAEVRTSYRDEHGKVKLKSEYLGKVIDLNQGLFKNNKSGIFKFNLESGVEKTDIDNNVVIREYRDEKFILDCGSSLLLAEFSKKIGLWNLYRSILPKNADSLMALVFYYTEMANSNRNAIHWLEGSFSSLLFPSAQLQSQRISELLEQLGKEEVVRDFFSEYLKHILPPGKHSGIMIDSTGLPNSINFPLTAVTNHNGKISEEVRLIYVIDVKTGLPLFFRYNAGNIVDVTTLKAILKELSANGVLVDHAIVDAGYCSGVNIKIMCKEKIKFLTRVPINRDLIKNVLNKFRDEVVKDDYIYPYNDRAVGIKRICVPLHNRRCYVYLCLDHVRRTEKIVHFVKTAEEKGIPRKEWTRHTRDMGYFGLVSSYKIEPEDLLPIYYTRQRVEQIFDVAKNNINIIPLRTHSEETFRGHIMVSFMSVVLFLQLSMCFKENKDYTAESALIILKNLKCKVYDDMVLVKETTKKMREILKLTGIIAPEKIDLPLL
jgi:hypothetical protein